MFWRSRIVLTSMCIGTILTLAAGSFVYLTFTPGSGAFPLSGWIMLSLFSAPVLGLIVACWTRTPIMAGVSLHLGLTSGVLITLTGISYYKNSQGLYGGVVFVVLLAFLMLEAFGLASAAKKSNCTETPREVFAATFSLGACLVAGWLLGTMVWSATIPAKVLTAAEGWAQGQPYCIQTADGVVRRSRDLHGLAMLADISSGMAWHFHALLIVDEFTERRYANWSYRRGTFMPVEPSTLYKLAFSFSTACRPVADFSDRLGQDEAP
jgi:hypothetical protein